MPEAITQWEQALRINPDYAEAQYNLGLALWQQGKVQQALRIEPDYPEAPNSLAWLLATLPPADRGDPVRAVGLGAAGLRTYIQSRGSVRRHLGNRLHRCRPTRRGGRHRAEGD